MKTLNSIARLFRSLPSSRLLAYFLASSCYVMGTSAEAACSSAIVVVHLLAMPPESGDAVAPAAQAESIDRDAVLPAKHLYGAKLIRRRMEKANATQAQLEAFDRLSYRYTADVMALRAAAGIDSGLIKTRDKAYKELIKTDLTGDAFWMKLQEKTGITDEQREAFRKTKERSNAFKAEARTLMRGTSADATQEAITPTSRLPGMGMRTKQTPDDTPFDLESLTAGATLIFEDRFERTEQDESQEELGPGWETNTKTKRNPGGEKQADLLDGFLRIAKAPRALHGVSVRHTNPFRDGVVAAKFRLHDEDGLGFHFNDPNCKESSAGHICRVGVSPEKLDFRDGKTGQFNLQVRALKQAGGSKDELDRRMAGTKKTIPIQLDKGVWYELTFSIQGDQITAWIDGKRVGAFASPGVDHPVKHNIALSVWGDKADVDNLRIWSFER